MGIRAFRILKGVKDYTNFRKVLSLYCIVLFHMVQRARKRFVNLAKQDPGGAVKQEKEEISPNHVQASSGASVYVSS